MRRISSGTANLIGKTVGFLGVILLLAGLVWVGWNFQPWMPPGHAVHVSSEHLGDFDFQVWQRKNDALTEPFTTGLFARKTGEPWKAYFLDIQDPYRPSINLRKEGSGVAILYGKFRRAYFDEERGVFTLYHYDGGSDVQDGVVIDSEPPDNWWQR